MTEYSEPPTFNKIESREDILEHVSGAIRAGFFEHVINDLRSNKQNGIVNSIVYAFRRSEVALNSQAKSIAMAVAFAVLAHSDFDPKELEKLVADAE